MEALLLPFEWFLDLLNVIVDWQIIPGVTFGGISLAILSIICIFRFIVFPLIGGSVSSVLQDTSFAKERAYKQYSRSRSRSDEFKSRYKKEHK